MNKKALELAISTIVLLVIGVFVLIGLIYAITGGFDRLNSTTDPFLDSTQTTAIKTTCEDACTNNIPLTYCCNQFDVNDEKITCSDPRLGVSCSLSCAAVTCPASQ